MVSASLGGYFGCVSLSRSTINFTCGARGRNGGYALAAVATSVLFVDPAFLMWMPKFVLAGLLLFSGLDLCYRWLVLSQQRLPLSDYLSLLVIAAIILHWGFISGVLAGVIIGCTTFAINASRVDAIKFSFDGTQYRSSLDRSVEVVAAGEVIAREGDASGSMHFILRGRVGIQIVSPDGQPLRVRSLGAHTTVGEMGLITGNVRTATIEAELETELYELDVQAYRKLATTHPALCQALLSYIITVMGERLIFANRAVGVLRR